MSKISLTPNASGTANFTIASPATNTDRTLTLPDQTGTVLTGSGAIGVNASAPTSSVNIDSSGNVGIGTSSPSTYGKFAISNSSGTSVDINSSAKSSSSVTKDLQISRSSSSTSIAAAPNIYFTDGTSTNDNVIQCGSGNLQFWNFSANAWNERMRIDSGGNVLVGTTTAGAGAGFSTKLAVESNAIDPSIFKWNGGATDAFAIRAWNNATSGNNAFVGFATETSYTGRGSIDYNRGAGQVRYNTTSDATLKNIIGDSDKQKSVEILGSTRIREYAWKNDLEQKLQIGVIAQELYQTYKGAVSEGGEDANGNYKPWGVDKTAFTFHLIAGWQAHEKLIQEQQTIIETLKADIAELKAKVNV